MNTDLVRWLEDNYPGFNYDVSEAPANMVLVVAKLRHRGHLLAGRFLAYRRELQEGKDLLSCDLLSCMDTIELQYHMDDLEIELYSKVAAINTLYEKITPLGKWTTYGVESLKSMVRTLWDIDVLDVNIVLVKPGPRSIVFPLFVERGIAKSYKVDLDHWIVPWVIKGGYSSIGNVLVLQRVGGKDVPKTSLAYFH